jgi:hypothetical protein
MPARGEVVGTRVRRERAEECADPLPGVSTVRVAACRSSALSLEKLLACRTPATSWRLRLSRMTMSPSQGRFTNLGACSGKAYREGARRFAGARQVGLWVVL